jgi:hypothetical protein
MLLNLRFHANSNPYIKENFRLAELGFFLRRVGLQAAERP